MDGPIDITAFADEAVRDPRLRPLMAKIKVIPDDRIEALLPQKTLMRVVATTLDRRQHVVEVFIRTTRCKIVTSKKNLFIWVEPALGKTRCRAALDTWWRLDEAAEVSAAMQSLDNNR